MVLNTLEKVGMVNEFKVMRKSHGVGELVRLERLILNTLQK